jgi:hypothetical protein
MLNFEFLKKYKNANLLFITAIIFLVLFFRKSEQFTNPQLYAEDGPVFFQQFTELGIASLVKPYNGYLHLLPRLIAFFFGAIKINYLYIPLCYSMSCFMVTLFIAVAIYRSTYSLNLKNRVLYSIIFVILPLGDEIFMNITNIMWLSSAYLIQYVFVYDRDIEKERYPVTLLVLFILSLTGPFSFLLSPAVFLILVFKWKNLPFKKIVPLGIILMGGFIQFICLKFIDPDVHRGFPGEPEAYHLLKLFTNNVGGLAFLKSSLFAGSPEKRMLIVETVLFIITAYGLVRLYAQIHDKNKHLLAYAGIATLASFVISYWPNESRILALSIPRYYSLPYICIAWIIILGMDRKINLGLIAAYAVFFVMHSSDMNYYFPDRQWQRQIQEYREGKREIIDISPDGWNFRLPKRK